MAHTNVGLANSAIEAISTSVEHGPALLLSGRTPTTERGRFDARTAPVRWGQKMCDQTALVPKTSEWDYELRFPEQMTEVANRARAITDSRPLGPVHVSLPQEVVCTAATAEGLDRLSLTQPSTGHTSTSQIRQAAQILARADAIFVPEELAP